MREFKDAAAHAAQIYLRHAAGFTGADREYLRVAALQAIGETLVVDGCPPDAVQWFIDMVAVTITQREYQIGLFNPDTVGSC